MNGDYYGKEKELLIEKKASDFISANHKKKIEQYSPTPFKTSFYRPSFYEQFSFKLPNTDVLKGLLTVASIEW
jgi:hypothetical protein